MLKAIIFDYDGVIVDSFGTVHEIYKQICHELGRDCPSTLRKFKKVFGRGAKDAYSNLHFSEDDIERSRALFAKLVLEKEPKLYKGIKEVIKKLNRSHALILATNNLAEEARQKLVKYKMDYYFVRILGADPGSGVRFRKSEAILGALSELNLKKDEVVYIGDRDIDLDIANEAGIKNVLMVEYGWGYHRKRPHKVHVRKPLDILLAISDFKK